MRKDPAGDKKSFVLTTQPAVRPGIRICDRIGQDYNVYVWKTQSSSTAQGIAVIRALETEKSEGERICYDPFARKFVDGGSYLLHKAFAEYIERRSPGFIGFIVARCRYIDDYLEACLDEGTTQVVILGAGLDSRAYRFEAFQGGARVFEVDQPATQAAKIKRVKKFFGEVPGHVGYVPIDFNEETLDKLASYGYKRTLRTLFIWEGVIAYLKPEAIDTTLAWVRTNSEPGSAILFDTMDASALTGKNLRQEVKIGRLTQRFTGEALAFGIDKDQTVEFMTQRGFTGVGYAWAEDFRRLYFTGVNQDRPVADIYSIVHAAVAG
ncbi:MAG: SAM-dependent methyltransferase [Anaerolineaceae bacterium]|nr:SAM-dependent methyltransferase [Anaerolineaceae bacterium]